MLSLSKIKGTPLNRNEMKQISGGLLPAGVEYRCYNFDPSSSASVCTAGGSDAASQCGYVHCDYVGLCSPTNYSCGTIEVV